MLPMVLSGLGEFLVAAKRMNEYLTAEEQADPPNVDFDAKDAVRVQDGTFEWEEPVAPAKKEDKTKEKADKKPKQTKGSVDVRPEGKSILPTTTNGSGSEDEEKSIEKQEPFRLRKLNMAIPRGSFVAIVGQVGSGKVCYVKFRHWSLF